MRAFGAWVIRHRGVLAVALLLGAVLFGGLFRVADGAERHSYNSGATPPDTVRLTAGHKYEVSVPGGRKALQKRGVETTSGQCSVTQDGGVAVPLAITVLSPDVRPTNALGNFVAPIGGRVHIDCGSWGAVFVDDSDDSSWDFAGLWLVLAAIFLTGGVALGLSALYARTACDDDEVERRLRVGGHYEVGPDNAGDVLR
ncbi:MAG TPA: hypothetical protein VGL21_18860 [Jatrophihabitantaceae bacterium]